MGREIRVFDGEVESLTEAGERGLGVRCWIDHRAGYAYGTELSDEGLGGIARDAVEAARIADADEFAAPPSADGGAAPPEIPGLHDPAARRVDARSARSSSPRESSGRRARPTSAWSGWRRRSTSTRSSGSAIASSTGLAGAFEATTAYAYLQAIAEDGGDKQTGLGFGMGRSPEGLDPEAIGREAAERAASLLGARKPGSRTCPVVLDPTVAASFVGFIGGMLCADAVQRGRSPFAGRLGEAVASAALTVTDDATDPAGLNSSPFDARGRAPRPNAADRGRQARRLPPRLLHRPPRAGAGAAGARTPPTPPAPATAPRPRSPPRTSSSPPAPRASSELLAEAGEGVYVTDVAGLHSGVNPVSGTFSVGATGRLIEGGQLAAPADEFTIASDLQSMLTAVAAAGSEPRWVPFGGSVSARRS